MTEYFSEQLGRNSGNISSRFLYFYIVKYDESKDDNLQFILKVVPVDKIKDYLIGKQLLCKIGKDIVIPIFADNDEADLVKKYMPDFQAKEKRS